MTTVRDSVRGKLTTGTRLQTQPDIQLLRAIAVLAVVVYHVAPKILPGGYVGVDVFFVISGYLITGHLARQAEVSGTINLVQFWTKRIRRLLPAALLVLTVTAVLIWRLSPPSSWSRFFTETIASATYWENWFLARSSVDYLAEGSAASPVQHYWSLSVEEQFYVVWPLLIVMCIVVCRRLTRWNLRRTIMLALATVGVLSLACSVLMTQIDPAPAYFVTPTRAWEFAAGGLLALAVPIVLVHRRRWRTVAGFVGIAVLAVPLITFTSETPFPGFAAAAPVAGTLLVILGGSSAHRWSVTTIARSRLSSFFGDTSYSLYLWHWPLVIFAPIVLGRSLSWLDAIGVFTASVVLGYLTKRFVEDPVRRAPALVEARPRRTVALAAAATAIALCIPVAGRATVELDERYTARAVDQMVAADEPCFGAAAFTAADACVNDDLSDVLLPKLSVSADDTGDAFRCSAEISSSTFPRCSFGSQREDAVRVAITGNSHATMLIPGLEDVAQTANWQVDAFVGNGCEWREPIEGDTPACDARRSVMQRAFMEEDPYDILLVTSKGPDNPSASEEKVVQAAILKAWAPVIDRGTRIIVLRDNPRVTDAAARCFARSNAEALLAQACAFPESEAYSTFNRYENAARASGGSVPVVDLGDLYCKNGKCPMAVGHVLVYLDEHHITATWSRTIAPFLVEAIANAAGSPALPDM
jgi:peptidoglycan/LPS O-acetylase OafA/YrhL